MILLLTPITTILIWRQPLAVSAVTNRLSIHLNNVYTALLDRMYWLQFPCPPLAIERYRNLVWALLGDKSCNSILERISASPDVSTQNHWLLFVNELLTSYPHLSSHSPTSINLDSSSYAYLPVIFDSIYFFISGGYFTYYECIKALYSLDKGVLIIVLVDYNMILFPELVELIHHDFLTLSFLMFLDHQST